MNEQEFTEMVKAVREAEKAIGIIDYSLTDKQAKGRDFSRSLYVVKDIKAGDLITEDNIKSVRPGFGLHPKYYSQLIGKRAVRDAFFGDRFTWDIIGLDEQVAGQ
jgi:pseudaminic acid synthase